MCWSEGKLRPQSPWRNEVVACILWCNIRVYIIKTLNSSDCHKERELYVEQLEHFVPKPYLKFKKIILFVNSLWWAFVTTNIYINMVFIPIKVTVSLSAAINTTCLTLTPLTLTPFLLIFTSRMKRKTKDTGPSCVWEAWAGLVLWGSVELKACVSDVFK